MRSSRKDTWSQNSTPRGSSMCVSHTHARNQARTHGHPPELMRCGGGTRPHTSPQSTFKGRHAMEVRFRALPEGRKKQIFDLLPGYPARGCGWAWGGAINYSPPKEAQKRRRTSFLRHARTSSPFCVCAETRCAFWGSGTLQRAFSTSISCRLKRTVLRVAESGNRRPPPIAIQPGARSRLKVDPDASLPNVFRRDILHTQLLETKGGQT